MVVVAKIYNSVMNTEKRSWFPNLLDLGPSKPLPVLIFLRSARGDVKNYCTLKEKFFQSFKTGWNASEAFGSSFFWNLCKKVRQINLFSCPFWCCSWSHEHYQESKHTFKQKTRVFEAFLKTAENWSFSNFFQNVIWWHVNRLVNKS